MKSIFSVMLAIFLAIPAVAAKVEGRGREWLDEQKDSPRVMSREVGNLAIGVR